MAGIRGAGHQPPATPATPATGRVTEHLIADVTGGRHVFVVLQGSQLDDLAGVVQWLGCVDDCGGFLRDSTEGLEEPVKVGEDVGNELLVLIVGGDQHLALVVLGNVSGHCHISCVHTPGNPVDAQINLGANRWAGGQNNHHLRIFCQK